jgi:hypothetical protein
MLGEPLMGDAPVYADSRPSSSQKIEVCARVYNCPASAVAVDKIVVDAAARTKGETLD